MMDLFFLTETKCSQDGSFDQGNGTEGTVNLSTKAQAVSPPFTPAAAFCVGESSQ